MAWISDHPIEWMPALPDSLRHLKRLHPFTWVRVLLAEFEQCDDIEIHVIALRSRVHRPVTFEQGGTTYHVLKAKGKPRVLSLFWWDTLLIRKTLSQIQPDLVHAWGTEYAAALVASRLCWPYLVTMQGLLEWYQSTTPDHRLFPRLMAHLEPVSLRRARVVTTESTFAVEFLRKRYPSLLVHQAEHASNRVFHEVRRESYRTPLRLISLGTMGYRKGTDLLFHALARLMPERLFELVVVGNPNQEYLAPLRAQLPAAFWERVTFRVDLSPPEVASELSKATLLVLPTRGDTSPNAVKEAAVVGVPVVASRVGGIPDYITHGKNGLLFPAGDLDALIAALRQAMTHPQFSKGEVDTETWQKVRDYLSPERMATNFLQAYAQVLKAWGRNPSDWSALN